MDDKGLNNKRNHNKNPSMPILRTFPREFDSEANEFESED